MIKLAQNIKHYAVMVIAALLIVNCASTAHKKPIVSTANTSKDLRSVKHDTTEVKKLDTLSVTNKKLSPASTLMIRACDNYLAVNPESPKTSEVLGIKASLYYNNKLYKESRSVYSEIITRFDNTPQAFEAVKMMAQAFYEDKLFDEAQSWYRKLRDMVGDGVDKVEAITRIAESIFRMAEALEQENKYTDAATQYERVALEFPESKIADVSLFNAGLCYEKIAEWSHAILILQRLLQRYEDSKIAPKAQFRIAKCYEKLLQWENAGEAYLRVVTKDPRNELAPVALYNAGFSFENANRIAEAAATFERMAQLYPLSDDAADVLFKAGELYGKIKDWESVSRVNVSFSQKYGNDADRVIQALCMVGIALYMQNKELDALEQLKKAISVYGKIKQPSSANSYYAAKAQFTIGEISHEQMKKVEFDGSKDSYKRKLKEKSNLLEAAMDAFSRTINYGISEWTTRSVFQIGQINEDFAVSIFKQVRPQNATLDERLALELGIAQAVERYFVDKAMHYHEQNVKLGIKEKIEDKYILQSRKKLTYLPYIAGENFLSLAEIAKSADSKSNLDGFALIAKKLQLFQKIAPYQERAIDLFLKSLEMGSTYQEHDEFFTKASTRITSVSLTVGKTYAEVSSIAREAPIPANFDDYETFIYKSKLLKQIETYEDQALTNYLKTLKIAEAYKINDESVQRTRQLIPELLFTRGRCYDLLCISAFRNPPYPKGIAETEKEEFKARFEEVGLKFQEQAFEIYKSILSFAEQKYASGQFVTHAYVRLFQDSPEEFGVLKEEPHESIVSSDSKWKCSIDSVANWTKVEFDDKKWAQAHRSDWEGHATSQGGKTSYPIVYSDSIQTGTKQAESIFFRREFVASSKPLTATLHFASPSGFQIYINGNKLVEDSCSTQKSNCVWDVKSFLQKGKNVIAVRSFTNNAGPSGIASLLEMSTLVKVYAPKVTDSSELSIEQVKPDIYKFPDIKNFSEGLQNVRM